MSYFFMTVAQVCLVSCKVCSIPMLIIAVFHGFAFRAAYCQRFPIVFNRRYLLLGEQCFLKKGQYAVMNRDDTIFTGFCFNSSNNIMLIQMYIFCQNAAYLRRTHTSINQHQNNINILFIVILPEFLISSPVKVYVGILSYLCTGSLPAQNNPFLQFHILVHIRT